MTNAVRAVPGTSDAGLLRAVRLFLLLLLCGDLFYIVVHAGHLTVPAMRGPHYSIETDGGLAEFYQYLKQLWLATCLGLAFLARRHLVLLAWAGFFGFLMLDDALQLHERIGLWLGRRLALPAVGGLRPDDFGEILVAATVGASLLLVLGLAWRRDRETTWRVSRDLVRLTAALAFCGVVVDTLHTIAFFRIPSLSAPLALLEDGGEMLVVSALAACALDLAARGTTPAAGLRRLLLGEPEASPATTPVG